MRKNLLKIIAVAILLFIVTVSCKKDVNVTNVTLDKNNITLTVGENETLKVTVLPGEATNKTVSWKSDNTIVADISNGMVTAKEAGTATITVTTKDGNYTATCAVTVISIEKGIVINGIKWATRNVDKPGTFAANPEDAGMFYQWNRKVGWSDTDPMINSNGSTTWSSSNAAGNVWEKANDPCPKGWRVPSHEEQVSLTNANSRWTTQNGVHGRLFGNGDQTLFLPAAGLRGYFSGSLDYADSYGYYWSNTVSGIGYSYGLSFGSSGVNYGYNYHFRSSGFSVRCVAE